MSRNPEVGAYIYGYLVLPLLGRGAQSLTLSTTGNDTSWIGQIISMDLSPWTESRIQDDPPPNPSSSPR